MPFLIEIGSKASVHDIKTYIFRFKQRFTLLTSPRFFLSFFSFFGIGSPSWYRKYYLIRLNTNMTVKNKITGFLI